MLIMPWFLYSNSCEFSPTYPGALWLDNVAASVFWIKVSLSACLYQANWGEWRCASIKENYIHTYKLLKSSLKTLIKMNPLPISLYSCKINNTYRCIFLSSLKTHFFFGSTFVYHNECFYNWIYSRGKPYIRGYLLCGLSINAV